jgi:nitrate/nitrite transporter NarK
MTAVHGAEQGSVRWGIGTATGLMLTLAAVGGFFIPIIFGHLVPHTSFDTGWVFLAVVSFAFALLGLTGRNPAAVSELPGAGTLAQPVISS